jgi:AraC family L-rhamnose operon transcriptional activator RhaR/AraC family L-rhamnose operon regulatory protein RhaS
LQTILRFSKKARFERRAEKMEVTEAFLPIDATQSPLLKLFNVHVESGDRPFRQHHHVQFEMMLCKSGGGVYTTENGTYPICAGDVFVFSSHEVHCITRIHPDPNGIHMMDIQFEPRYLWGSRHDSLSSANLQFTAGHAPSFSNRLPFDDPKTAPIRELMLRIEEEFYHQKTEYPLMVRSHLAQIIIYLLRECGYADPEQHDQKRTRILAIKSAVDYISAHLAEQFSLQDVANVCCMTPNYLSTLFHKTMGISLWNYVMEKRVQTAMTRLDDDTDETVLEIALNCGFNNTAAFNKAFKAYTGCTPREYRNHGEAVFYS